MENKKKQHEWNFMGNSAKGRGDLAYCSLCDQWKWGDGKLFKMDKHKYQNMIVDSEIKGI